MPCAGGGTSPLCLHPSVWGLVLLILPTGARDCVEGFMAALPQSHVTLPNGYHIIIMLPEAGSPLT